MKEKDMEEIRYNPIGVIRSEFKEPTGTPIQPSAAAGIDEEETFITGSVSSTEPELAAEATACTGGASKSIGADPTRLISSRSKMPEPLLVHFFQPLMKSVSLSLLAVTVVS